MLDHLGSEALDKNVHPIHEPIINSKTNPVAWRCLSTFVPAQPGRRMLVVLPPCPLIAITSIPQGDQARVKGGEKSGLWEKRRRQPAMS